MSVRVSPISKWAAILIMALGGLTLLTSGGETVNVIAGFAFIALGLVLYRLLYRFTNRIEREIGGQ